MAELTKKVEDSASTNDTEAASASSSADTESATNPNESEDRIAIVGMACRFPGAPDLETFWQQLLKGANCASECPAGQREGRVGELYEDTLSIPSACRFGAFLTDIDQFDAEFFRISPPEAEFLDPQQRMMLETSWRALENANIDPEQLRGSSASVYAGMSNNDYRYLILGGADTSQPASSLYTITGTSLNTAIGRVSFALGFEGPAMTVDTACSSSLVAMHQAVAALQLGETDVALAGGVQLVLSGKLTELRANANMLSPDGCCKTFDARANGYVRGEGCGIVVLKRLQDAERDGDHIWAVVASTAINQDGTSEGLTVPRGSAQKAVILSALQQAELKPTDIDYLEAHGTGTPVGDPIEINAAAEIYGSGRSQEQPLLIGSVKTNMGHLEPAAGVAGVIKTALAMKFGTIPKHLNFETPNPAIEWDRLPVSVTAEQTPWPDKAVAKRHAGINSFGFSGTNAHVILQGHGATVSAEDLANGIQNIAGSTQYVGVRPQGVGERIRLDPSTTVRRKRLMPVSAKSPEALCELGDSYASWERVDPTSAQNEDRDERALDFAWTASVGRSHFNYRKALIFEGSDSLSEQLQSLSALDSTPPSSQPSRVAFAYTGQGSQWAGMGGALYESEPVFRDVIDRCEAVIQSERKTSLIDRIFGTGGDATDLEDPQWVQPCIYAVECALTDLWRSIGVEPYVVLGHSLGEIAASRTAAVWSLEDGCRFASARGRLMSQLPGPGAMAAVFLEEDELRQRVDEYNDQLNGVGISLAALNGAHQALSGYEHELEPLVQKFEEEQVRVRRLKKSPAYHSALVEPILDDLAAEIAKLNVQTAALPLVSNLSGKLVEDGTLLDGEYWKRHARNSVAYRSGVAAIAELGVDAVLEIGPNSVLGPMTEMCWPETSDVVPTVLASLRMPREDRPEIPTDGGFIESVGAAYEAGFDIDFRGLFVGEHRRKIEIPGYPFQRRRHWVQTRKRRSSSGTDHPLLGAKLETPFGDTLFQTEFSVPDPDWLTEHRVFGQVLVPGAVFGSMACAGIDSPSNSIVSDLQLHNPMMLKDSDEDEKEESRRVQTVLKEPDDENQQSFEVYSKGSEENQWTLHATGQLARNESESNASELPDLTEIVAQLDAQDIAEYYRKKATTQIQLGLPFRNIRSLWSGSGQAVAEISLRDEDIMQGVDLQPLMLDACFQVLSAARESSGVGEGATYIPFGWERLTVFAAFPPTVRCHAQLRDPIGAATQPTNDGVPEALSGDLSIFDRSGRPIAQLEGFTVKRATRSSLLSSIEEPSDLIYEIAWRDVQHPAIARKRHPLPALSKLDSSIDPFFDYLSAQGVTPEQRYSLLQDLERLAQSWVVSALDAGGLDRNRGAEIHTDELIAELGILPTHQKLIRRILRMLSEAGVLSQESETEFKVLIDKGEPLPEQLALPEALLSELQAKHPHGMYEMTLLSRFGSNLIKLLTGNEDPLALLFQEDDSGAADFYKTAAVSVAGNQLLGDVIAELIADLPNDRLLRVIEVGAGTGATTEVVFDQLASTQLEYTYTDISAGFFGEAERNFAARGIDIEYRALDIENDPNEQGFDDAYYDIVIAANVLHATRNLFETLSHCRQLLVPGGMLIALESLRGRAWQDLTFGFLDGWWRYNDAYRKNHALASPEMWTAALADAGFVDSRVFGRETLSDESGPLGSGTVVARAPDTLLLNPGTWVVEPDSGTVSDRLIQELKSLNQSVVVTSDGADSSVKGHEAVEYVSHGELPDILSSLSQEAPLRGVLHLRALDGHAVDATTAEIAADVKDATGSALRLTQALMEAGVSPANGTWFITRGAQVLEREQTGQIAGSALWGFGKVVDLEASFLTPRMVDLDPINDSFDSLFAEVLDPDDEDHIAYRGAARNVARLVAAKEDSSRLTLPSNPDWIISSGEDGSLQNVRMLAQEREPLAGRQLRVRVEAAGLNFSDVLVALGAQVPNASLGLEFAGYVTELGPDVGEFTVGERVVGMGFGTFGPEITTHAGLVASAPDGMTFHELATLPIVFSTAAISFDLAELTDSDLVLIHSAAGGVGLAAIQLVQAAGGQVVATTSGPKQAFLRSLGLEHVLDSRSLGFREGVASVTEGNGATVVLNSLTSEGFIDASLGSLAPNGRFIEIGRLNILTPQEMEQIRPDVDYHIVSLDELKREQPEETGRTFRNLIDRFKTGELRALHHSKWPITEIVEALQYMGSARHIGKLVLTFPPLTHGSLRSDRTYLITGGFGGIGCSVADWLAERGARYIVLNGRRAPDEDAIESIEELRVRGIEVVERIADVTHVESIDSMLDEVEQDMPPLGGVIHSVGVLSDGALPNQTWERYEQVLWPKILGAWRLHERTKHLDLDLFVLFSSATGVLGNAGQANHAAANSFLDQLAAHRRSLGLAGQSIAWGAWSEIGEAAEQRQRIATQLETTGTGWISPEVGIRTLDHIVSQDLRNPAAMSVDWDVLDKSLSRRPMFLNEMFQADDEEDTESELANLDVAVLRTQDTESRTESLIAYIQHQVQSILRLPSPPSPTVGFFDLGMDSLMAVELRNRLIRVFEGELSIPRTVVFDYPDVQALSAYFSNELQDGAAPETNSAEFATEPGTESGTEIAVIGMACRFPKANDYATYWRNLQNGVSGIRSSRDDSDRWSGIVGDVSANEPYARTGGFVDDIDGFDAGFFRIRTIEARGMDPRQRMLLETCWEAIENAGIDPTELRGARVGLYIGLGGSEYRDVVNANGRDDSFLGTSSGMTTGRIAYVLGLTGPAISFDMACASSLAAIHEGAKALQCGEVDLALAGGANALLSPSIMRFHRELGLLSTDGQCLPFDENAAGYMRGEGCGILVLKRPSEAQRDGDPIWASVLGSAVNQNGASAGLTVPNGNAQEQVMRDALGKSGRDPDDVAFVEAHAIGLTMSDPIEIEATASVYTKQREREDPLLLGSVKGNIGHLEWAAGVAGVIKLVLSMAHGRIPGQAHFQQLNQQVDWQELQVDVNRTTVEWPGGEEPPIGAVSAFGMSGTNAHLIVQGAELPETTIESDGVGVRFGRATPVHFDPLQFDSELDFADIECTSDVHKMRLLPLSGRTPKAVMKMANNYLEWFDGLSVDGFEETQLAAILADVAWTASVGRTGFDFRHGVLFSDFESMFKNLRNVAAGTHQVANVNLAADSNTAFVFSGADSDWLLVGRSLYESESLVKVVVDYCNDLLLDQTDISLIDAMQDPASEDQKLTISITTFVIELAVSAFWHSLGLRPSAVLGRNIGSLAACCVAGSISLEQGLELAVAMGRGEDISDLISDASGINVPKTVLVDSESHAPVMSAVEVGKLLETAQQSTSAIAERDLSAVRESGGQRVLAIAPHVGAIGDSSELSDSEHIESDKVILTCAGEDASLALAAKQAYESGLPLKLRGMFAGESRRRVSLPTYPFDRKRFWFDS